MREGLDTDQKISERRSFCSWTILGFEATGTDTWRSILLITHLVVTVVITQLYVR